MDCMRERFIESSCLDKDFPDVLQKRISTSVVSGKEYYVWVHVKNFRWKGYGLVSTPIRFKVEGTVGKQEIILPLAKFTSVFGNDAEITEDWPHMREEILDKELSVNISHDIFSTQEINGLMKSTQEFKYFIIKGEVKF